MERLCWENGVILEEGVSFGLRGRLDRLVY